MSGRHFNYDKGSSRSARDDSRGSVGDWDGKQRRRSRSRSPHRERLSPPSSSKSRYSSERSTSRDKDYYERSSQKKSWGANSDSEEEVPAPPPPPRISKISIGFTKPKAPIKMNIGAKATAAPKQTVASVFGNEDDDEPEEMPAEAKMRMRNIGRETPTSAGPNSFGKTKQGFCDSKKVFEKNLKHAMETPESKSTLPKFPQTIYKIKP